MSGVLLGSAVIGGVAGWGGSLLSKKKKTKALDIKSPYETPEYAQYKQSLNDMLAKRDVYSPEFMSSQVSPGASTLRANLKDVTAPLISTKASQVGLGRSSIVPNILGQESGRDERTIAQMMATIAQRNEDEKNSRYLNALDALKGEATGKTDVENARIKSAWDTENTNKAIAQENKKNMYSSIIQGAMSGAMSGGTTGGLLSSVGSSFSNGAKGNDDSSLSSLISLASTYNSGRGAGSVRLGTTSMPASARAKLASLQPQMGQY